MKFSINRADHWINVALHCGGLVLASMKRCSVAVYLLIVEADAWDVSAFTMGLYML